jgi:hypothetical protein
VHIDPVHWFLSPAKDTRSSLYLEDAATEFQVQGLELDWTIVTWDDDLRWSGDDWSYHSFRGAKRVKTRSPEVIERVGLLAKHQATAAANAV